MGNKRSYKSIDFPELSPTLFTAHSKAEKQLPQLLYQLPGNFDPDKSYPVFVYLPGGTGEDLANTGLERAISITKNKDYIVVTMPLFRKGKIDKNDAFGGLHIGQDDYPVIIHNYTKMLQTFFKQVPQAKRENNVMGGFSNGGHTIGVLVSAGDAFTLRHFSRFLLIDGGQYINGFHRAKLQSLDFLVLVGDSKENAEDWERAVVLQYFYNVQKISAAYGVKFKLLKMRKTGHEFPDIYNAKVLNWLQHASR